MAEKDAIVDAMVAVAGGGGGGGDPGSPGGPGGGSGGGGDHMSSQAARDALSYDDASGNKLWQVCTTVCPQLLALKCWPSTVCLSQLTQ